MIIPADVIDAARAQCTAHGTGHIVHIYAGMQHSGDGHGAHAMDQRGRWAASPASRPWWCPPGQPYLWVATMIDTGRGVEIMPGGGS